MKLLYKIIPWFFLALFGIEVIVVFMPKSESGLHIREFGRLPVLMNGRIQPMDSVGRNTLLQIRSTGDVPLELVPSWKFWHHAKKLKSSEWLLEVFFKPDLADTRPIFLIHHPELIDELNLGDKGIEKSGLRYYTFKEIEPVIAEIQKQGSKAASLEEKQKTAFHKQVLKLNNAVFVYQMMKASARPPSWNDFEKELASFKKTMAAGLEAMRGKEEGKSFDEALLKDFMVPMTEFFQLARDPNAGQSYPLVVPPTRADQKHEDWSNIGEGMIQSVRNSSVPPPIEYLATIASAYTQDRPAEFNTAVASYREWFLKEGFAVQVKKGNEEFFYNDTKAFVHAVIIYIAAFLLAATALLTLSSAPNFSESLRLSAYWLIILGGAVHTFGLVFRMYLESRPPVTNLYSSAVFIGWGAMIFGIFLERIYKLGIGSLMASLVGFVTLFIAHNLALGGDTMEMMRAVLDSNFWLATHVVTITMGYSATFAAGFLAVVYVFLGLLTPLLGKIPGGPGSTSTGPKLEIGKSLSKMVYAIICFATLFSFAGTVLGGIWADQSWGRFWGWDPKENGALLIVLWNAVILHARWGGLVRDRGLMNLAIFGNIITAFSWFGVNMLGIGLHSYGFMDAAFWWLILFIGTQAAIIGMGLLPMKFWRSFQLKNVNGGSSGKISSRSPSPAPAA
ncbi:MAG: cytochrome c biogenesis protein CcsA [Verrucomicrobia bacterium]|nr:cytochrome c biogenesis protein CcsA [Verrucomicrobiota bacterium]